MLTVLVKPKVVCGRNNGGEDLFLAVRAKSAVEPDLTDKLKVKLYKNDDAPGVSVEFLRGSVRYTTCHYGLVWEGVPKAVLGLSDYTKVTVEDRLRNPANWTKVEQHGKAPYWRFSYNHFVDGNAD